MSNIWNRWLDFYKQRLDMISPIFIFVYIILELKYDFSFSIKATFDLIAIIIMATCISLIYRNHKRRK